MDQPEIMDDGEGDGAEVEDSDEDIYGDLESDIFFPPTKKAKQSVVQDEEHQRVVKENQSLRAKVKQLHKEKKTCEENFCSLRLTAKNEIDKKNFIIKNLGETLKKLAKSKSILSQEATEEILTKCQEALLECQAQVTLEEMKNSLKKSSILKDSKRKHLKFGNMSFYFFREQGDFQREETVDFPKRTNNNASSTVPEGQPERVVANSTQETDQPSHVPNHTEIRIEPPKESPTVVNNLSNPTSLSITSENINIPGKLSKRDSDSHRSGSSERPAGFDNRRRKSAEQENNRVSDERPSSNGRRSGGDSSTVNGRPNREYSPSTDRHYNNNSNNRNSRGGPRGKETDSKYGDSYRNSDYRPRTSKRFSNGTRYSSKRHRSRSRSR